MRIWYWFYTISEVDHYTLTLCVSEGMNSSPINLQNGFENKYFKYRTLEQCYQEEK